MQRTALIIVLAALFTVSVPTFAEPLDDEMEEVKKALLDLKRDLVILVGEFFHLDSVSLKINGKEVTCGLNGSTQHFGLDAEDGAYVEES